MPKDFALFLVSATMLLHVSGVRASAEVTGGHKILTVVRKMISVFENVEDFTCEIEVTYYKGGVEDQQWRVKFFYTKEKKFRVDFSHPYKGVSVIYKGGEPRSGEGQGGDLSLFPQSIGFGEGDPDEIKARGYARRDRLPHRKG